jgi:diguanylate cyclase (GGDEF)-like protein
VYGVVAAVVVALMLDVAKPLQVGHSIPWPLVCLAFMAAEMVPVLFHGRDESIQVDLLGVPMVVGAVFTSPLDLLMAVSVAVIATAVIQSDPLGRATFNLVNHILGVSLARLVMAAVLGTSSPVGVKGLVAVSLSSLVFELSTMAGVLGAVTLSTGWAGWRYLRNLGVHVALIFPLNAVFGIITITVGLMETWGILLLAGPAVVLALWYRNASQTKDRYANLQELYSFTVKLSQLSDSDEIVAATLREARTLLRCGQAELRLPADLGGMRCTMDYRDELVRDLRELNEFESQLMDAGVAVLVPRNHREQLPHGYNYRDLMAVPVNLGDLGVAALVVGDYEVDNETFDSEDLRFLEAFAASLGTALTSSQRLSQLRMEVEARQHQALHDSLTGLANRVLFGHWMSSALDRRADNRRVAVMIMDLDGFKDINDTLGHHTGDAILKVVGSRVLAAIGSFGLAARLGGDEFAFVVPNAASADDVMTMARAILDSVSRPVSIDGLVLELRASIGVAMAPQHGTDGATLLRRADVAMYAAKTAKRGAVAYDQEIDLNTKRRLILATELRQAMDAGDLQVWYQPVAQLDTGEICGLEALLRWTHHIHGPIAPSEFVHVAEQSGLIEPLTWWVLETALRELHRWRRDGYELGMAVNISARNLLGPEIVERLGRMLSEIGVPPADLTLEITESLMMTDPDGSERILLQLAALGVRVAIDDFGTGYSSLSRLKRLPVTTVKVDRSFVQNMHHDGGDDAIVRATIELARNMGHSVIAEGVEHQQTWDRLLQLGCDQVQGHLLAAAMPAEVCRRWIRARQVPRMAAIRVIPSVARGA